jgi:hypothetical protein
MPKPIFLQPINATFTLSDGVYGVDHTFDGITVAAETATADFFRKFLLDGFIALILWFNRLAIYKKQLNKIPGF